MEMFHFTLNFEIFARYIERVLQILEISGWRTPLYNEHHSNTKTFKFSKEHVPAMMKHIFHVTPHVFMQLDKTTLNFILERITSSTKKSTRKDVW
jgi:hypothetical protein